MFARLGQIPKFIPPRSQKKNLSSSMWSPLGSSLLCFADNELLVLCTEPPFKETVFPVDGQIKLAEFSPRENFIFMFHRLSPHELKLEILEAKTGNIRLTFIAGPPAEFCCLLNNYLQFNYDDTCCAVILSAERVVIYKTKTFSRVMKCKKVKNFSWSPCSSLLAVFCEAVAKVIDVCTGKVLYKTGWKGVDDYKIIWESSGNYLACLCKGANYKKIFLVSLKSARGVLFVDPRLGCIDFAWRGNGKEFAVTRGPTEEGSTIVHFYTVNEDGKYLYQKLHTVEGLNAHLFHWSPNGRFIVMQGPTTGLGELYFYDVDNHQQLSSTHFVAMNCRWDFSSRFFLTQSPWRHLLEDVVRIWSSHGEKLIDVGHNFFKMVWSNKVSYADGRASMDVDSPEGSSCKRDGESGLRKRPRF